MTIERCETFAGTRRFTIDIDWVMVHEFNQYLERQLNVDFKPILLGDIIEYYKGYAIKDHPTSGERRMTKYITAANGCDYCISDIFNDWLENHIYNDEPDIDVDEIYDIEDRLFL